MNKKSKIFLETTMQIGKFIASAESRKKIKEIIDKSHRVSCSTYVKMEFKRRFIQDLVYLYNVLRNAKKISDVFFQINRLHSIYNQRKLSIIIASLAYFFNEEEELVLEGPFGEEIIEIAILYFRQLITTAWDEFDSDIDEMVNCTDCVFAKTPPVMVGNVFDNRMKKCKKSNIRCNIVNFFEEKKADFGKIYKELCKVENIDNELKKTKRVLKNAIKNSEIMADRDNCWSIGDAIIAVEFPNDFQLFTTNIKHFTILCPPLQKSLSESI